MVKKKVFKETGKFPNINSPIEMAYESCFNRIKEASKNDEEVYWMFLPSTGFPIELSKDSYDRCIKIMKEIIPELTLSVGDNKVCAIICSGIVNDDDLRDFMIRSKEIDHIPVADFKDIKFYPEGGKDES